MRITKVYTKTGDAGKTRLAGGQQVWKDSVRVEAYGTVDEINASIGVVRVINADMTEAHQEAGQLEEELRWIQNKFILPGGGKVSGFLHQARTICRRAERICIRLAKEEPVEAQINIFLNRLSDALFVLARWVAKTQGEAEFLWERTTSGSD